MIDAIKNMTVIYAEDDDIIRENTATTLQYLFNKVISKKDGLEALEFLKFYEPDVLITDYVMPQLSGYELIIEAQKLYPQLIIFVTSSYTEQEKLLKCIPLGIADYLVKPISYDQLVHTLEKIIAKNIYQKPTTSIPITQSLYFNVSSKTLIVDDREIALSKQEVNLINVLLKNRGNVLSKKYLIHYLYGDSVDENLFNNTIYRLRKKVGKDIFTTLKNIGYILK